MSPEIPVQAVLLDIDGTLIDSNEAHAKAWCEALNEFGHHVTLAQTAHEIGKGADQLMPVFLSKEELARDGEALQKRTKEIFTAKYREQLRPFACTRELVQRLQRDGRRVVIASSAAGDELEHYKRVAHIDDLVHEAASSDDAEHSKPAPDIFQAALAQLNGTPREQVIVIGDSPYDAEAARKAGLRSIGVLSGHFPEAELREAGCSAIYRDVADLLARYETSPLGTR
jgi:HAD superfamily hydrolase (TIGR01549 family)